MSQLNLFTPSIERAARHAQFPREKEIKRIIEALLFSSNEALSLDKIREVVQTAYIVRTKGLKELIDELASEYANEHRSFQIDQIADGYLLRTHPDMRPYIEQLYGDRRSEKLSPASAEVLAIIAYRGPITRREIEKLRGVDCSGTVASLMERGLIEGSQRLEAPGRPLQFTVTKMFLQHFGLNKKV